MMAMETGRPVTPDGFTTLGSISLNLPGEGVSLSSQSALPPKGFYSPHDTLHYSNYTPPKTVPASLLSPQLSPDSNRDNVMSALKKLQEKIRRLEMERSAAEGNLRTLANETTRYRDLLNRERSFKPYEPVQSEVSRNTQELQSQLNCAESRCGLLEKQLEYMRKLVQDSESDKIRLLAKQREHESKLIREDVTAKVKEQKLSEIARDHNRLSQHQNNAENKIHELEKKLTSEIENRKKAEEKLKASVTPKKVEEKRLLKKKVVPKAKSAKCEATQKRLHYHLNLNEMPFLQGQSTSPSHNVSANVQKVLALMKSHNNVMCEKREGSQRLAALGPAPSSSSSSESDLNELILQLQDEYAQMGFEHKELSSQLAEEEDHREQEDLERELELLTAKMEIKSDQINQLKHHLQTMDRKKLKRKVKNAKKTPAPTAATLATARRQKTTEKTPVRPSSTDSSRNGRLQILRDMKMLQSSLRPDDLSWDR